MKRNASHFAGRLVLAFLCAGLVAFPASVARGQDTVTQGPRSPGTIADDKSYGNVTWSKPKQAAASDDVYAVNAASATTHYLRATNFGFTIPSGATVRGITVEFEIKDDGTAWREDRVRIVKAGRVGSTERSLNAAIPDRDRYLTRGSASDLWGETWTPGAVNTANFGFVIAITGIGYGSVSVDHLRLSVHYSPPEASASSAAPAGESQKKAPSTAPAGEKAPPPSAPSSARGGQASKKVKSKPESSATPVRVVTRPATVKQQASSVDEDSGGGLGKTIAIVFAVFSGLNFIVAVLFYAHSVLSGRAAARRRRRAEERPVRVRRPAVAPAAADGAPPAQRVRRERTAPVEPRPQPVLKTEHPSLADTLAASAATRREAAYGETDESLPVLTDGRRETCTIALWRQDGDCGFYARGQEPDGKRYVAARSPLFRWNGDESPPQSAGILAAHSVLVQRLAWEGWKLEGQGGSWWERSFWRAAEARSVQTPLTTETTD